MPFNVMATLVKEIARQFIVQFSVAEIPPAGAREAPMTACMMLPCLPTAWNILSC
jgi:hypothetical protein